MPTRRAVLSLSGLSLLAVLSGCAGGTATPAKTSGDAPTSQASATATAYPAGTVLGYDPTGENYLGTGAGAAWLTATTSLGFTSSNSLADARVLRADGTLGAVDVPGFIADESGLYFAGDAVYVRGLQGGTGLEQGSYAVASIDATGKPLWSIPTGQFAVINQDVVVDATFTNGQTVAGQVYDATTGKKASWSVPAGYSPTISENHLLSLTSNSDPADQLTIDTRTGSKIDSGSTAYESLSAGTHFDGDVVSDDSGVHFIAEGQQKWTVPGKATSYAVGQGKVVIANSEIDRVVVFDAQTGKELSQFSTAADSMVAGCKPLGVLSASSLAALCNDGSLAALAI